MSGVRVLGQLLILSLLFHGCRLFPDCDPEPISEAAKKWVPYQQGQELYFESASGKDTLDVIEFIQRWNEAGAAKCTPSFEHIGVMITSRRAFYDTLEFSASRRTVAVSYGTFSFTSDSSIAVNYEDGLVAGGSLYAVRGNGEYQSEIVIDGKVYREVVTASCSSQCNGMDELSFSKNAGVVSYKVDGVVWTKL